MHAYIGFLIDIDDAAAFSAYGKAVASTYGTYGGEILFRGPIVEVVEGALDIREDTRLLVLEFPSIDKAHAWWNSDEYRSLAKLRQPPIAQSRVFFIDGVPDPAHASSPARP
jgi:uncharacterized protein (DUF1330 family)